MDKIQRDTFGENKIMSSFGKVHGFHRPNRRRMPHIHWVLQPHVTPQTCSSSHCRAPGPTVWTSTSRRLRVRGTRSATGTWSTWQTGSAERSSTTSISFAAKQSSSSTRPRLILPPRGKPILQFLSASHCSLATYQSMAAACIPCN